MNVVALASVLQILFTTRADELARARPTVVYCASGYRSMIAASWLSAAGFVDVSALLGGYTGWTAATVADEIIHCRDGDWTDDEQQKKEHDLFHERRLR